MKPNKSITALAAALCLGIIARAEGGVPAVAESDSLSVAVGTMIGDYVRSSVNRMASLGAQVDIDTFVSTLTKVLKDEPTGMTEKEAESFMDKYMAATRRAELPDSFTPESQEEFLRQVGAVEGAITTPSGLVFIVEREGEGRMPVDSDKVRLKYTGRFSDGSLFDATATPIEFGVTEVAPGFSEGLKKMKPGGIYRIVIPASLAYGPEGISGAIPGNAALDFRVELIEIE